MKDKLTLWIILAQPVISLAQDTNFITELIG